MLDVASIPEALRLVRDPALARIEDASLTASQPREQAFYDGWVLRHAAGKAKRARSVNLIGAGDRPLEEKLAHCAAFYAQRALPFLLRITPFSRPAGIDARLARAGYDAFEDTRVMVLPLASEAGGEGAAEGILDLDASAFGATLAALHGLDAARAAVEQDRYVRSAGEGAWLVARSGGRTVACGSAAFDGPLAGIYGMVTAAADRGRGHASRLVAALLARARARGCTTAYLQVQADNAPARRAYGKFGFTDGYAYWYRRPATTED